MNLLHNARIRTLDPSCPQAEVLAFDGHGIHAVGGQELLDAFPYARKEDMGGRVLLPGLIDAHLHLQELALQKSILDCALPTKAECLNAAADRASRLTAGEWLRGHGWNQNDWGGAWPCAADLDAVSPGRPAYLSARSLHAGWANSAALALAGINAQTADPPRGRILRDEHGVPTGILIEAAMKLVEQCIPEPDPAALAQTLRDLVLPDLWRMGLTGVHDFDKRTCFQALQVLEGRGDLHLRVVKSIPHDLLPEAAALGLRTGFGREILRIGAVKFFADGALGPHTCAMFEPFENDETNLGMLAMTAEEVFGAGCQAGACGLSLAVHAIGDRAVHAVLDGLEQLRQYERTHGLPELRHRIEHVQVIHPGDAGRLARLGVIASMQPIHATSDMEMAEKVIGSRCAHAYALRTQLENGARLALGSDAPVESANPFAGLHAAVTRRRADGSPGEAGWHPEQRLTVGEALQGFTQGPAYAAGMEARQGSLRPGSLADLIVLNEDPFVIPPGELLHLLPERTMIGGHWVWQN